jgi:hypothetical protein
MDPIKLDDLTRSLFVPGSRRQVLTVAGAGLASLLAQVAERVGAKGKKNKNKKK